MYKPSEEADFALAPLPMVFVDFAVCVEFIVDGMPTKPPTPLLPQCNDVDEEDVVDEDKGTVVIEDVNEFVLFDDEDQKCDGYVVDTSCGAVEVGGCVGCIEVPADDAVT
jgi:hypothetical protein